MPARKGKGERTEALSQSKRDATPRRGCPKNQMGSTITRRQPHTWYPSTIIPFCLSKNLLSITHCSSIKSKVAGIGEAKTVEVDKAKIVDVGEVESRQLEQKRKARQDTEA